MICESTGGYERALVAKLLLAKIEVCVVNPGRVRAFAQAEGLLAKTDPLDAQLLRRFGQKVQPRLHAPMDQAAIILRELLDYRRQVSDQLVAVGNRLELAGKVLRPRLDSQVSFLQKELTETDRLIQEHIDPTWQPLLQTPPFPEYPSGHSVVSSAAAQVLTHLFGDRLAYSDSSEIAYGLAPREFSSFRAAAQEAALSRLFGGIHYRDGIENGLVQGRAVGQRVVARLSGQALSATEPAPLQPLAAAR